MITRVEIDDFYLKAKSLKEESLTSLKQRILSLDITKIELNNQALNREIFNRCNEAFENFKKSIRAAYPELKYDDLIIMVINQQEVTFTAAHFLRHQLGL